MKFSPRQLSVLGVLALVALAGGCSSDSSKEAAGDDAASGGNSSGAAGKTSSQTGSGEAGTQPEASAGSAGVTEMDGADAGSAGSAGSTADAGEGGATAPASGSHAGTGGSAGHAGHAGTSSSGGSGGHAGTSGTGGGGGASGGGGTAGHAGTSGSGGTSASGGSSGSVGSAGAGLGGAVNTPGYIPASKNCAAGNVLAAYSVCRNCHGSTPDPDFNVPFTLVTLADLQAQAGNESDAVSTGGMPKAGAFAAASNCSPTGTTTSCKNVLLNWLAAGANGVAAVNGLCPAP